MSQIPDKGMFLWRVLDILDGSPKKIADALNAAGICRLDVKVSEAAKPYSYWRWQIAKTVVNVTPEWLAQFRNFFDGQVMGWGFCYGYDPEGEGRVAAEQVRDLKLDAYGFNCETVFERQPNAEKRASDMMAAYRLLQPNTPTYYISWPLFRNPYPDGNNAGWHYDRVAKNAMVYCNYAMPMIYYPNTGAYWAKFWLENSIKQWRDLVTDKPIIPVGRLYTGDGGTCTPDGIEAFGKDVRERFKLSGESWWRMGTGIGKADWWQAMSELAPFTTPPPPATVPIPTWRNQITQWARSMGYDGPFPDPEIINGDSG